MFTIENAIQYAMTFPDAYRHKPFRDTRWEAVRFQPNKKIFLLTFAGEDRTILSVKVDPEWRDFWRAAFSAVRPGYHLNKQHWNTVLLDGTVPVKDIKRMIKESYLLISDSPSKRIYEAVKKIPKGKVATYAQVAGMAGNPRMSRAVGNALHKNPDPDGVPCYRVVNARGELSGEFAFGGPGRQRALLEADGVGFIGDRVDMENYQM